MVPTANRSGLQVEFIVKSDSFNWNTEIMNLEPSFMSVSLIDTSFFWLPIGVLKFLGVNLLPLVWVSNMIRCQQCEVWVSGDSLACPACGTSLSQLIKEPEDHGFYYLIINPIEIPNDC